MNANMGECIMTELPETETTDPKSKIKVKVENLRFNDIPTLISNIQFELLLDDRESFHSRQSVKANKKVPANSFTNEYNLLEKKLEKCCEEFDKIKKKTSESM
jgi:hypothetical protein